MTDTAVRQETDAQKHGLTIAPATALVTGTIIGSGIFTLPAALAAYGPISLVGFAITAFGAMMLALVFSSLARRSPDVGGPYAFARKGFGDFVGFESAWTYWIGAWAGVAAISVSMVGYLGALIPAVSENRLLGVLCALGAIALLTAVNVRGVVSSSIDIAPSRSSSQARSRFNLISISMRSDFRWSMRMREMRVARAPPPRRPFQVNVYPADGIMRPGAAGV